MHRLLLALTFLLALAAAGCATQADPYQRPDPGAPARWSGAASGDGWPERAWWSAFGSAELDALIAQAEEANHDLRMAAARIAQARADAATAGSALYPVVSFGFAASRSKDAGKDAGGSATLGPQLAYQADPWGRQRDAQRAASALLQASEFDEAAVRIALAADVANAYFTILSLNDRLQVATENVAVARRLLDLLTVQQQAGRTTSLEVEGQRSLVATTQAALPSLLQQRTVARDVLAVLLGRPLEQAPDPRGSLRALSLPPARGGVPSQLVERRPDVRRAEAQLQAANARVGVARGALLPDLTLRAVAGASAGSAGALFASSAGFYSLAVAVAAPLFDGGALRAGVDLAQAQRLEREEFFRKTVVTAFAEVEDALAGMEQFAVQEDLLAASARSAREALRLVDIRYRAGAENYINLLDAQRTRLTAESAVDQARLARFNAATGLYRALGGGWQG